MKYILTIAPALEQSLDTISFSYRTADELERATDNMANLLLFIQDELKAMPAFSNAFTKEQYVDGEWEEME